jgi:citrate synthase
MDSHKKLKSDIARIKTDQITVHGLDLSRDILGKVDLGQMAFLQLKQRLPTPQEAVVFNAILVTLVEHGMSGAAIVARMTYSDAPDALQAAVAAGLCGMVSGALEKTARMLQEALADPKARSSLESVAASLVAAHGSAQRIPGLGLHFHSPTDPRTETLFEIARANGCAGPHVALLQLIEKRAQAACGKPQPINAPGAIAAIASDLELPWQIVRSIGVIGRTVGLVGHILEEMHEPLSREIAMRIAEETSHAPGS